MKWFPLPSVANSIRSFVAAHRLEAGMTQRRSVQVRRRLIAARRFRRRAGTARPSAARTRPAIPGSSSAVGFHVEGDGQHAAADVATDSLRIDQVRGGDDDADADVGREVHVRHDRDLLDVRRVPEALDRLRHVRASLARSARSGSGASDDSLILTSIRKGWHERQLRRALAADRHRDFRTQAWGVPAEALSASVTERSAGMTTCTSRCPQSGAGDDLLDEQIIHAIIGMAICEREVQCPLDLSTELTCLSFSLPT